MPSITTKRGRQLVSAFLKSPKGKPYLSKGKFGVQIKKMNAALDSIRQTRNLIESDFKHYLQFLDRPMVRKELKKEVSFFLAATARVTIQTHLLSTAAKGTRTAAVALQKREICRKNSAWIKREIIIRERQGVLPKGFWDACLAESNKRLLDNPDMSI